MERTETSITVAWDPPIWQPANCNLTYSIYTSINDGPRVKTVQIVDQTVAVILSKLYTTMNQSAVVNHNIIDPDKLT